ncbi:HigA family addiction module antitoxin [Persicitalea sp.]|uniref:HigA family addiction module antitoxin n=1 Tax=Persicitalea sp. TaxID=3100273 RepID=UPI0035943AB0
MTKQNQYFPQSRPHPGETLQEKLDEMGMLPKEFALQIGRSEEVVYAILGEETAITPEMAALFENVLDIPTHFWISSQDNYDAYNAL